MQYNLTVVLIDGCVDDLIGSNDTICLCWLRPANLSDSGANYVKSQSTRFTRHWNDKICR